MERSGCDDSRRILKRSQSLTHFAAWRWQARTDIAYPSESHRAYGGLEVRTLAVRQIQGVIFRSFSGAGSSLCEGYCSHGQAGQGRTTLNEASTIRNIGIHWEPPNSLRIVDHISLKKAFMSRHLSLLSRQIENIRFHR